MEGMEVTLENVMQFREKKAAIQDWLISGNTDRIVVALGMNIPGTVKTGPAVYRAFLEGMRVLEEVFRKKKGTVHFEAVLREAAGYAAVCQVEGIPAKVMKKCAVEIEETHRWGRIFDIDVIDENGALLTREEVGGNARKCILCGRDAKVCGRSRTHTARELYEKVLEIMEK